MNDCISEITQRVYKLNTTITTLWQVGLNFNKNIGSKPKKRRHSSVDRANQSVSVIFTYKGPVSKNLSK